MSSSSRLSPSGSSSSACPTSPGYGIPGPGQASVDAPGRVSGTASRSRPASPSVVLQVDLQRPPDQFQGKAFPVQVRRRSSRRLDESRSLVFPVPSGHLLRRSPDCRLPGCRPPTSAFQVVVLQVVVPQRLPDQSQEKAFPVQVRRRSSRRLNESRSFVSPVPSGHLLRRPPDCRLPGCRPPAPLRQQADQFRAVRSRSRTVSSILSFRAVHVLEYLLDLFSGFSSSFCSSLFLGFFP